MNLKASHQLSVAKRHYYARQLVEAYHIFRRYFDRIPFCIEEGHAEHIGMFVRILSELGKTHELSFYLGEFERHYLKSRDPAIAYPLAVIYRSLPEPRLETAKKIFEEIIDHPGAGDYGIKAKMMLAHYYDGKKQDTRACRQLIFSMEEPADTYLSALWKIWKARILRDERSYQEAEEVLLELLEDLSLEKDWYAYFSAQVVLAGNYLKKGEIRKANELTAEIRRIFERRQFKSLKIKLEDLEARVAERSQVGVIQYIVQEDRREFTYQSHRLCLKQASTSEKLLTFLVKKKFLDKHAIVSLLYERAYQGIEDDKRIYYHIHSLRKRLRKLGLPGNTIANERSGYRLVPRVEVIGGRLWS